jgi:hypothetical protein
MSAFHALMAELKAVRCHDLVQKCVGNGALTPQQAKRLVAEINRESANEIGLSKAIPPGPPIAEIIKHGYFSELPRAPFQAVVQWPLCRYRHNGHDADLRIMPRRTLISAVS